MRPAKPCPTCGKASCDPEADAIRAKEAFAFRCSQAPPSCNRTAPPISQAPAPKRELTVNCAILVVPKNRGVKFRMPPRKGFWVRLWPVSFHWDFAWQPAQTKANKKAAAAGAEHPRPGRRRQKRRAKSK